MWKIPKEYGHFAFGAIQAGVTCAVASAIATMQFVAEGAFVFTLAACVFVSWAVVLPVVVVAALLIRRLAKANNTLNAGRIDRAGEEDPKTLRLRMTNALDGASMSAERWTGGRKSISLALCKTR